jgi:RecA/RadA recombinase
MMTCVVRDPHSFRTAKIGLSSELFAEKHRGFAALWAVVFDYNEEFGGLPDEDYVVGELERRLEEDPDAMTDEGMQELDDFIARAYKLDPKFLDHKTRKSCHKHLRQYLEEQMKEDLQATLSSSTYTPTDMCGLLEDYKQAHHRLASLDPEGLDVPFPEGWESQGPQVVKRKTGIDYLDWMLNGGKARGEVYGLLGPSGSCKTTLAVQYAVLQAQQDRSEWRAATKRGEKAELPITYYFFYEATLAEFRVRALSCHGQIDRTTLENGEYDKLSTRDNLKPYERRRWQLNLKRGNQVMSESERFKRAQKILNLNLRLIDMTGNDEKNPGRGWGMVDEIAQIIQMDLDQRRARGQACRVGSIVIDYAGAAVKRFLDHEGKDYQSNIRHYIGSFGMQCKNKLAIAYDCDVLVLHQFSGKANSMAPGVLPASTDAAESKNWRENLDFSLLVGNPNNDHFAVFGRDKARRAARVNNIVVKINGKLSRVDWAKDFAVDPVRRTIVHKRELHSVDDDDEPSGETVRMDEYDEGGSVADDIARSMNSGAGRRKRAE